MNHRICENEQKGDFENPKIQNHNFSTKSVPDYCSFSNSAISLGPKNSTNQGIPVVWKFNVIDLLLLHEDTKDKVLNSIYNRMCTYNRNFRVWKKNPKWATQKKISFSNSPILNICLWKFHGLVLGLSRIDWCKGHWCGCE